MSFREPSSARPNRLKFRLRTLYRWIDGEIDTMHRRLIDVLNRDDVDGGLVAESVSAYDDAPPDHTSTYATINFPTALFAVPVEEAGSPPPGDPFARVKKEPVRVEIGIGPYTVTGNVYLIDGSSPREALRLLRTRFFAITRATIQHVDQPGFREEHAVVFINRGRIDYVSPAPEVASLAEPESRPAVALEPLAEPEPLPTTKDADPDSVGGD